MDLWAAADYGRLAEVHELGRPAVESNPGVDEPPRSRSSNSGELSALVHRVGTRAQVVALSGEVDRATVGLVEDSVREAADAGRRYVVLDLLDVSHIERDVMEVFGRARELLEQQGGRLVIVCGRPALRDLFRQTGLAEELEIFPTMRAALGKLAARHG